MKLSRKEIIEITGLLAVVGSLLFVGVQLALERNIALGDQYHNRAESRMANLRANLESDVYLEYRVRVWESGDRPSFWTSEFENLVGDSPPMDSVLNLEQDNISLAYVDNLYFQYRRGLLDETYWSGARDYIKRLISGPIRRANFISSSFNPDFSDLLTELVSEIETE
ncbi:MAG: hypothetical protein JKY86_06430 [Gammaproteobacteria bacterium]|nr:hypothetical protein [Gammaproteobacteria bacterium]